MSLASSTTWLFVRIYPRESIITPDPALIPGGPPGPPPGGPPGPPPGGPPPGGPPNGPGGRPLDGPPPPVTATLTTAGPTFSTISEKPSINAPGIAACVWAGTNHPFPQNPPTIPSPTKRKRNPHGGAIRNGLAVPANNRDMCIIPISCSKNLIETE